MKKFKKTLAMIITAIMLLQLSACSSVSPTGSAASSTPVSSTVSVSSGTSATATADVYNGPTAKAKAPTGIKVACVPAQASLSGCSVPIEAIQEIGKRYNWDIQIFDGQGTPDAENKAIMNAVAWKPDAIVCVSLLASSVQQGLKAAKDAGIPVVSGSNGTDSPNPKLNLKYDFAYDVGPDYAGMGTAMANWIKTNTEKSGYVAVFACPGSYSVDYFEKGLIAGMKANGTAYSSDQVFTFEQLGDQLTRMVIGFVTTHPNTEFVFLPFDPAAVSVAQGLKTAGITNVKVLGVLGNTEMCTLITQGTTDAVATAAYDNVYLGYGVADQMIRLLDKQDLFTPHGENLPFQIVDKTNAPESGKAWVPSFDYKDKFYSLWD